MDSVALTTTREFLWIVGPPHAKQELACEEFDSDSRTIVIVVWIWVIVFIQKIHESGAGGINLCNGG